MLKTYCCNCGKKLGQGIKLGDEKKGYGDQSKRRFHKTCEDKKNSSYSFHMCYIYKESQKNYYNMEQHYNFINKAEKKTPTNDITRTLEYKKHMEAKAYARKQQEKFDKKYS